MKFESLTPDKTKIIKGKYVRIEFVMNSASDADIIKKLQNVGNKSDYIRKLIRKDIMKGTR